MSFEAVGAAAPRVALPSRSALALAEAIVPGSTRIPAADEATVAQAQALVEELHPAIARTWRVALAALDAAAIVQTGRPFRAHSASSQDALLRRWESDAVLRGPLQIVSLVFKIVHFDRVGARPGKKLPTTNGHGEPRWARQVLRGEEQADGESVECDVVVVGTGAGGAVVGRELAERGHAVVFLEEGELARRDAFDGSSLGAHKRFYRGAFSLGNVPMPIFMGRLVGGSTAINGGTCLRTPPWVLDEWCEALGTDELSPEAMKPYFDRVESILEVAPSSRSLIGPVADVVARGCDALGWTHFAVPRNAPGCDGSGFCDFGCQAEARRGTHISYVPPALERGAVLFTGLRAERVIVEGGRAAGVVGVAKNGRRTTVRARTVVLAGGAIPTPLLLLGQGLANSSGQVGKHLSMHPSGGFGALFDDAISGHTHVPQGYGCDQFLREGMLMLGALSTHNIGGALLPLSGRRLMETIDRLDHIASFGLLLRDTSRNGRVWRDAFGVPAVTYNVSREDTARMQRAMIQAGEMCLAAGAKRMFPIALGGLVLEGARDLARFAETRLSAGDIIWGSYHPLGTVQMGRDPKKSVVGLDHQSHDVRGLYVVDGSTVPGPPGVNPQLTIMALATRAAVKIAAAVS